MRFADRMDRIKASGVRAFFEKASRMRDPIDLSIGQADFDVPDAIKTATIAAMDGPTGRYSATQGYPDLIVASKAYLAEHSGLPETDEVMMTAGASGAITLTVLSLAGPGDEVLVPDPHFVIYPNVVQIAGATPVYYDLTSQFRLDLAEIERRITPRTRLIIVNSPANPTGAVLDAHELGGLADLAAAHDLPIMCDELYELFVYDGVHTSIKRFPHCRSIVVGGLSKSFGMAGWRLGWAAGPGEMIDKLRVLQQFCYTCPPTLSQRGAMAAFDVDMSAQVAHYRDKRGMVVDGLRASGFDVVSPQGSFFLFPKVPWGDDETFCQRALESNVIVVPGRVFSHRIDHFRISMGAPMATLERGVEILGRLARSG